MRLFPRLRFRTKLNLGIGSILVAMALLLLPLIGTMSARSLVEESKKRGSALVESLAIRAVDPMLARDFLRLKNMVDEQSSVEDVAYAFVQDKTGHVMVHTFQKGFPVDLLTVNQDVADEFVHIQLLADGSRRIYDFAAPVLVSDGRLGTVRIGLSQARIQQAVQHQITLMAGLFAGALILAHHHRHYLCPAGHCPAGPVAFTCRRDAHRQSGHPVRADERGALLGKAELQDYAMPGLWRGASPLLVYCRNHVSGLQ